MMSGELDELARAAADTLVAAMVTDSWDRIKRRFAALVGHERRMDAAHDEIAASSGGDRDRLLQEHAQAWATRLLDVLDDNPAAAEGLRALLAEELGSATPLVAPVIQRAQADRGSQAVNVGGGITGNTGEVYVGVGKVDKRTVNRFFAPFVYLGRAVKQAAVAHTTATAVVAVVVVGVTAVTAWRISQSSGTPAKASLSTTDAAQVPSPGHAPSSAAAQPNQAGAATQVFPDGTKVTLVSAEWTALTQYDQAPYGVKFIFRIVAGPQWSNSANVHLCANCGDQRPLEDYMVTINDWSYPATNSTGYADLASTVTTAQGGTESFSTDAAATLTAGDSVSTASTLIPPSGSPGAQQVVVTIEMPDTTLASETFLVNVSPNPDGPQP